MLVDSAVSPFAAFRFQLVFDSACENFHRAAVISISVRMSILKWPMRVETTHEPPNALFAVLGGFPFAGAA